MKIVLVSSAVPLINGGARFIVEWLASKLRDTGHQVEVVLVPTIDDPKSLFSQMTAFRMLDLEGTCDRVITFRPPAHVVQHRNKVVWFIHHIRGFYDLWETPYRAAPDTAYWQAYRRQLVTADTNALLEARSVFTNSKVVSDRLQQFNGIAGEVLYPPVFEPERFRCESWGDEIVCVCRLERHKRQDLLVEAMRFVKTPVRLRLAGDATDHRFVDGLYETIKRFGLRDKVTFNRGWISEDEKIARFSTALASAYFPLDEDSYGYPTIEAAHAQKATIGALDGGGVSEFIRDGENGYLLPPEPEAIADAFDRLWSDRQLAQRLGRAARARIDDMNIGWDHVIERLLS